MSWRLYSDGTGLLRAVWSAVPDRKLLLGIDIRHLHGARLEVLRK
jgi:hypothetical protein